MSRAWRGQLSACGDLDTRRAKRKEKTCQRCGSLLGPRRRKFCAPCCVGPILTDDSFHGAEPMPAPRATR